MVCWLLILIPLAAAFVCVSIRWNAPRRLLLLVAALAHAGLTATTWIETPKPVLYGWLGLDAPGRLFLTIMSGLFLAASFYAIQYLRAEDKGKRKDFESGALFINAPEPIFTGCLLCFQSAMTAVCLGLHFGVIWVAIELTTLASAPLIYFHRHPRSLEATWKYLLICSIGIAVGLLGNFFIGIASTTPNTAISMVLQDLLKNAHLLNVPWLKAAFILLLVGYGTKMGLAPMHTWLPDAHSEAPSVVSALLSGALLNCAFLGILRAYQVCDAAGQRAFAQDLLVLFGFLSIACAAVFIIGQRDYKRMLAYSSIEHMGILSLGIGLGGSAVFGAMLHAINHSLTKASLFFVAGNILTLYKTKSTTDVRGMIRLSPITGVVWVAGILAITGFPPFGLFVSEFILAREGFIQGRTVLTSVYLLLLTVIFIGIAGIGLRMAQGRPENMTIEHTRGHFWAVLPPLILICLVLTLGCWIPGPVMNALQDAARVLGGQP